MSDYVQLVGTDTPHATGSCYFAAAELRILFNCPEGTQRFAGDARIRITKCNTFMFTRIDVATTMGLPGFLFTINDTHIERASFGGPPQLLSQLTGNIARSFFHFRKMTFDHLPLAPGEPFALSEPLAASSGCDRHLLLPVATGVDVWSYLVTAPRKRTFNPAAARALGVSPGPKFALLKQGKSVLSDRDPEVTVTSEQVCDTHDAALPPEAALILDCNAADEGITSLAGALKAVRLDVRVVVYLSRWAEEAMSHFASLLPAAQHVAYSAATRHFSAFPTALVHRYHLNMLSPLHFPVCRAPSSPPADTNVTASGQLVWPFSKLYRVLRGATAPAGQDDALFYPTKPSAFKMLSPGFVQSTSIQQPLELLEEEAPNNLSQRAGYVAFLGTGSAVPSKYRNVSGLFVCDEAGGIVVCDFGEGSLGQWCLLCNSSSDELDALVGRVSCVFISHMHADHNLGFFALLQRWLALRRDSSQTLLLVAPRVFLEFILGMPFPDIADAFSRGAVDVVVFGESWSARADTNAHSTTATPHWDSVANPANKPVNPTTNTVLHSFAARTGVLIDVFPVDHPAQAHGIVVKSNSYCWIYTGDTRPTPLVVAKAKQYGPIDMLIHEATFDDSMGAEACAKKHSTLGEALATAEACGANEILLTHFSQRYPKVPVVSDDMVHRPFCFAFDLMVVPFGTVTNLHKQMKLFQLLLQEYELWAAGTGKRLREEQSSAPN